MLFSSIKAGLDYGYMITRKEWPLGTFIFRRPSDTLEREIIMNVRSLPIKFKEYLQHNVKKELLFTSYICKFARGRVENGYQLSSVDIDANDWMLLDENAEPIKLDYRESDVITNIEGERITLDRVLDDDRIYYSRGEAIGVGSKVDLYLLGYKPIRHETA